MMTDGIQIACSTENLKEIRQFVNASLARYVIPENDVNMIILAVDEICANRIIHSNKSNKNNILELEIEDLEDGLLFNIKDKGDFYDNTSHVDSDIETLIQTKRKGGIGLMLVRRIMDSIEVTNEAPYTIYTLFKKLPLTLA